MEVFRLVDEDRSTEEIASHLGVSVNTVRGTRRVWAFQRGRTRLIEYRAGHGRPRLGSCGALTPTYLLTWGAMDLRTRVTFDWLILFLLALTALIWGPLLYAAVV